MFQLLYLPNNPDINFERSRRHVGFFHLPDKSTVFPCSNRVCCSRAVLRGIPRVTQDRTHFTQKKNAQPALCVFYFSIPGQTDACRRGTVSGVMIIELLSVQSLADSSSGVNDRELLVFVTGFLDERCLKGVENGAEGRC